MGEILDIVKKFLQEDDWKFSQLEGKTIFRMGFSGKNGNWTCYADAKEEKGIFVFNSYYGINVPEEKRQAIAEFLTRANYGLLIGNFEMDLSDGQIGYKTSIDVEGDRLTPTLVKHLVYCNLQMMDKYLPGVMAVIYGGATPEKAIENIEGKR